MKSNHKGGRGGLTKRWKLGVKVRTRETQLLSVLQVEANEQREATSSFVMIVSRRAAGNISRLLSSSKPSTSRTAVVAINGVSLLFLAETVEISLSLSLWSFCVRSDPKTGST